MTAGVLMLNRSFYAIQVTTWERALSLLYLDRASVVDDDYGVHDFKDWLELSKRIKESPAGFIHTPSLRLAIPEVIALKFFDKVPRQGVPFTRRNIYEHYGRRCCYCGKAFSSSDLNLDHVVPVSRGGTTDWGNIVTACLPCNLRKGSRTPQESGMRLLIPVSRPRFRRGLTLLLRSPVGLRRSWQRFIDRAYWDSRIEE